MKHTVPLTAMLGWSLVLLGGLLPAAVAHGEHPLSQEKRDQSARVWREQLAKLDAAIAETPEEIGLYSRRGDLRFFLGDFAGALADYDRMVQLSPDSETSHWRRGIAAFYSGEFKRAAAQFDSYHSFDNVDRENGIWRYFSHVKASGKETARKELLKYEKDDREPFPSVYKLFAGETTPEAILSAIADADIGKEEREKRLFYAELYIGLNHAVDGRDADALAHLEKAVANEWGPRAGYGPNYMWHVGRVNYELLREKSRETGKVDEK